MPEVIKFPAGTVYLHKLEAFEIRSAFVDFIVGIVGLSYRTRLF